MRIALYIVLLLLASACRKEYEAPVPDTTWDLFESAGTLPVDARAQGRMEGVFAVIEGADMFGAEVVLNWSWIHDGPDTAYTVSMFCAKDIGYLTGEGRYLDSTLLLNTYWRTMANTGTGLCRLMMHYDSGVRQLWGNGTINTDSLRIEGVYGDGTDVPDRPVVMVYRRPLQAANNFQVIAHRCGGRNADLLPVSENSVEMIRMASRLGATGIEMDVRLTRDGVPVIYHDETLNARSIQPCGLFGPVEEYSYAQLDGIVRLMHGERIPTLREALDAVVHITALELVWLDMKNAGAGMHVVRDIQMEYLAAALTAGRDVEILIGLPEQEQVNAFLALPDHSSTPSLCELELADVRNTNALVWAPRWTLGLQSTAVAQMHAEGRRVFTWTIDQPEYVQQYLAEGSFDGMLSDYPMLVAHKYHVR